jgi:outer membrane protein OmpA-like peptidoglycan-associated protein
MRRSKTTVQLVGFALALALSVTVFGHDSTALDGLTIEGQKVKIEGIVTKREDNTFALQGSDGTETVVVITAKTDVRIARRFRADKPAAESDILRGLRLKVEGNGDSEGQLIAKSIRFDERDLMTAQALESRVTPVEKQAESTEVLAEANEKRIDNADQRIDTVDQNAQRLAGQLEELSTVANAAGVAAQNAEASADKAQLTADTANDRISAVGDYSVFYTVTVYFRAGSAVLSRAAKKEIDEKFAGLGGDSLRGFAVSVVGFADSTGNTNKNRSLSAQRAEAVIRYLVTQHNLPLERLVQPFGYGSANPVATNHTDDGRSQYRRAEIRILVNKGITASL